MAKTVTTHITDDLDGASGAEEVPFSYGGVDYTIDLSKKNRAAFDKAIKQYVDAATRVTRRNNTRKANNSPKRDLAAIREWAKNNNIDVSERGRIAASVIEQYDAAPK